MFGCLMSSVCLWWCLFYEYFSSSTNFATAMNPTPTTTARGKSFGHVRRMNDIAMANWICKSCWLWYSYANVDVDRIFFWRIYHCHPSNSWWLIFCGSLDGSTCSHDVAHWISEIGFLASGFRVSLAMNWRMEGKSSCATQRSFSMDNYFHRVFIKRSFAKATVKCVFELKTLTNESRYGTEWKKREKEYYFSNCWTSNYKLRSICCLNEHFYCSILGVDWIFFFLRFLVFFSC